MDSKIKYLIIFASLIVAIIVILNVFPQWESTLWYPIRTFLKQHLDFSFVTVILFSLGLAVTSSLVAYIVLDLPRLKRYQKEIKKWKAAEERVKKLKEEGTPNKKLALKVKRKKKYIEKIQRDVASERMKPTLLTMVPFMVLFIVLNGFIFPSASGIIVAIFPFNLFKVPFIGGLPYLGPINQGVIDLQILMEVMRWSQMLPPYFGTIPPINIGGGIFISANYFFQSIFSCNNGYYLYFSGWYFIGTFGFNSILQRVLGLNLEM